MSRYFNKNINLREAAPTSSPNTGHSGMNAHTTHWNVIFTSLIGYEVDVIDMYYVSIMMWIFYIDWQQHWECDRTMNIGANAHGEPTVSTKQPQVTTSLWQLGFQWHRRGIQLVFKSLDCFTKWLFHSTTFFFFSFFFFFFAATYVFVVWNFTRLITRLKSFFSFFFTNLDLVGEHSAPMYLLFAPYTDL